MSSIRDPAIITNVGRKMMTAGGDITYTKAVLYGQDISHLTKDQLEGLTSIGNPLMTVPVGISDKNNAGANTTVVLEATFQNTDLKADLPYTAVGFFAKRGDDAEKLVIVGVANAGAYLVAASPDGVATDALDIKVAIAIGDATNVTAVIDPAGSVTPATLNAAINKVTHDLTAKIDVKADQDDTEKSLATKADKTTVESDLATKADQSSLDETNAEVAKKADSEDVTKQLATKANVSDVDDALSKKDDTADVDQKIATVNKSVSDLSDTVSANKTATDASLATKANASDVADNVKTLQANIDTKADKATIDAEIAKIDFTPYAKSADVAKDLQGYTTTTDLTKLLAGKRDIADSYSRDELDKKFLQLSTDTSGKVSADQIAKLLASKVDKTDLTSQLQAITDSIGTKANSANVTAELAKKDNTADVDAKIKTVTDLANTKVDADQVAQMIAGKADKDAVDKQIKAVTDSVATKANSDDVYSMTEANNLITDAKNTGKQAQATADSALAGYNKRPVISGGASDDLLSFKTTQLRYYPGNGNTCKNLPPATNQQWFTVEYIFENPNGDGIAIYRSPANEIWTIGNNGGYYDQAWVKVANANDIQGLQNQINTKADTATVNSQVADAMNAATKAQDTANQANTNISKIDLSPYAKSADVNSELANKASTTDVSNGLAGKADKSQVNVDGDLFSAPGSITSWASLQADGSKNVLRSVRTEGQGTAFNTDCYDAGILFGGNDTKALISVGYTGNRAIVTGGNNSSVWHEDIAWKSDVTNLQNQVNTKASASNVNSLNQTISALQQTVQSLQNTVNQQATQITGLQTLVNNQAQEIKQLQETTIKGKTFSKSQEAAAEAWEKQNSQQIAFILDN